MKQLGKVSDFTIKVVMMFTTIITLLFFWNFYNQPIFLFLGVLHILAIVLKGISNIFDKE